MKKRRVTEDIEKNTKALRYGQVLGITYDFECPQKHRLGFSVIMAELNRYKIDPEVEVHGKVKS